jgi:hypothetical protein
MHYDFSYNHGSPGYCTLGVASEATPRVPTASVPLMLFLGLNFTRVPNASVPLMLYLGPNFEILKTACGSFYYFTTTTTVCTTTTTSSIITTTTIIQSLIVIIDTYSNFNYLFISKLI